MSGCALKAQCTTSDNGRRVERNFDEEYLDTVRSYMTTEPYKKALRKRKVWVEPLFGEGKQWHGMERFRLKSVSTKSLCMVTDDSVDFLKGCRICGVT